MLKDSAPSAAAPKTRCPGPRFSSEGHSVGVLFLANLVLKPQYLVLGGFRLGGLNLRPPPLLRVASPSHLHLHIGVGLHVGLELLTDIRDGAPQLLGVHHVRHWQIHHWDRSVANEVLGRQQRANFSPDQMQDPVLGSLGSATSLSAVVPLHSHGKVLPAIPKLLQRKLMAIDAKQGRQGPGLNLLLPTDPDTAIGRRRFI